MPEKTDNARRSADLTAFVTTEYYVVGAGDSFQEVKDTGEWVATVDPVDVRR